MSSIKERDVISHPLHAGTHSPGTGRPSIGGVAATALWCGLLAVLLTGCGSDGDAGDDQGDKAPSASARSGAQPSGGGPANDGPPKNDSADGPAKALPNEAWPRFEVGQCVADIGRSGFRTVSCATSHQGEVVGVATMPSELRPNSIDFNGYPRDKCTELFQAKLAAQPNPTELIVRTLAPSVTTWQSGDRRMTCIAARKDGGPLTGALAD
jgi:hypothetical protein